MSQELQTESTTTDLAELKKLFGPPPVLSTESADTYYAIMAAFVKCFKPEDFMVQMFMKDLTDSTWDAMRYTRHKTLTMERKYRQGLEHQAARAKEAAERKRLAARSEKERRRLYPRGKAQLRTAKRFRNDAPMTSRRYSTRRRQNLITLGRSRTRSNITNGSMNCWAKRSRGATMPLNRSVSTEKFWPTSCAGCRMRSSMPSSVKQSRRRCRWFRPACKTNVLREQGCGQPDQRAQEPRTPDRCRQSTLKPQCAAARAGWI